MIWTVGTVGHEMAATYNRVFATFKHRYNFVVVTNRKRKRVKNCCVSHFYYISVERTCAISLVFDFPPFNVELAKTTMTRTDVVKGDPSFCVR